MKIHDFMKSKKSFLGKEIKQILKNNITQDEINNHPELLLFINTLQSYNFTTLKDDVYYYIVTGTNTNGIFRDNKVKTIYVKRDLIKSPRKELVHNINC